MLKMFMVWSVLLCFPEIFVTSFMMINSLRNIAEEGERVSSLCHTRIYIVGQTWNLQGQWPLDP